MTPVLSRSIDNKPPVDTSEFLSFHLGAEEYGIDILGVQEIRGYTTSTKIANSPIWMKGVQDLRGVIVPIIDLRLKFGMVAEYGPEVVTIILNLPTRVVGIVVDSVSDVVQLTKEDIKPSPRFEDVPYAIGVANLTTDNKDRMLFICNVEKLVDY